MCCITRQSDNANRGHQSSFKSTEFRIKFYRMKIRVGLGYDVHVLEEGRDFFLGGVKLPATKGAVGHSGRVYGRAARRPVNTTRDRGPHQRMRG